MAENNSGNARKEQAEATKRRLVEAAKKAFSEKGYKGKKNGSNNRRKSRRNVRYVFRQQKK